MKPVYGLCGLLIAALLLTNGWWLYQAFDHAATEKYHGQMLDERQAIITQVTKALPDLCAGKGKPEIVASLERASGEQAFDKEGVTVVGWLVLTFDRQGRLVKVAPAADDGAS